MSDIIKSYIDKHYDPKTDAALIKRMSYEQARKFQSYYQYLELAKSQLIRKKDEPIGLRNIGNTCYLNIFLQLLYHVNDIRNMFIDQHFSKERLLFSIQNLFAKMLFSKFSYCDTEEVFEELNKVSKNKIDLGVQFDFHEYLSIQLDNIEKSLKRQGLNAKSGILDRVFCGKYSQQIRAGEEISVSESKFGMITLNAHLGSFEVAYEMFKNYKVQGYKTKKGLQNGQAVIKILQFPPLISFFVNRVTIEKGKLQKNNIQFKYPRFLQLDKSTNEFVYHLSEEDELLQKKISKVEDLVQKKQYKKILESLMVTKQFLQNQSYQTVDNATLDVEGLDNHFGIMGSEENHQSAKNIIDIYIKKLESQEAKLTETLQKLTLQKRVSFDKKKLDKYSLFALMIHIGSATSGHYFIYIYNESQRKWRKYSDRLVEQVTQEQVHLTAQGKIDQQTNVCCIIYKHPDFKCNPSEKPIIPASLKTRIVESDNKTQEIINNLRIERMVRTCANLAEQQTQFFVDQFSIKKDMFIQYFSQVVNYYIQSKNIKMAELSRLKALLMEPSFQYQVASQLSLKTFSVPEISLIVSKDYANSVKIISQAILFDQSYNIQSAIAILSLNRPSEINVYGYYEQVLIIFMLKGCFYLDLYQQIRRNLKVLIHCINYALGLLKKSIFTDQISLNIRSSVANAAQYLKQKVDIQKVSQVKVPQAYHINIKKTFDERFQPWIEMYLRLKDGKKTINQQQRNDIEMPFLVEYSKNIK